MCQAEYCFTRDYLCYRLRDKRIVWVVSLAENLEQYEKEERASNGSLSEDRKEYLKMRRNCRKINMRLACTPDSLRMIEVSTVPLGNHTSIKSCSSQSLTLYNNLVQYSVKTRAIIYDLDELREVGAIEGLDALLDPDLVVVTGFNLSAS